MTARALLVGVVGVSLHACSWYVPEARLTAALDLDGDGFLAIDLGGPDCDDLDAAVHPQRAEICGDRIDNDCDGRTDDFGQDNVVWYLDADGDGFGLEGKSRLACPGALAGQGWSRAPGDCNDADPEIRPGRYDADCDFVDEDCDGDSDEDAARYWPDEDEDTFGDGRRPYVCAVEKGYVADRQDCNDDDASINPLASEACDGVDNDCDGTVDVGPFDATYDGIDYPRLADAVADALLASGSPVVHVCDDVRTDSPLEILWRESLVLRGPGLAPARIDTGGEPLVIADGALTLENLAIHGAGPGGAVVADDGPVTLIGCELYDHAGPAVWALGDVDLVATVVRDNGAPEGAGIYVAAGTTTLDADSAVLRNTATGRGGGAFVDVDNGAVLVSQGAAWGAEADDNAPDDVATPEGSFDFDGPATFTCSQARQGCD